MRLTCGLIPMVLYATACASGGDAAAPSGGGGGGERAAPREEARPTGEVVKGNYSVSWKSLSPRNKGVTTFSLVNESSEIGTKLSSGKATSSEIRVITDAGMAWLVDQLKQAGFYQFASDGLGLANAAQSGSKSGVVVVQQDGRTLGLALVGPGAAAQAYETSKQLVMRMHSQASPIMGDIKVSTGPADESIFSAPKPPPLRRP